MLNKRAIHLLVMSQLCSVMGTMICQFSLILFVLDQTRSINYFASLMAVMTIGRLMGLPIGGILVDRYNKKKIMVSLDGLYFMMTLYSIVCIRQNSFDQILLLGFMMGLVSAVETPLVQASLPLFSQGVSLLKANSLISGIGYFANIVAPAIGGYLYATIPLEFGMILCLIFYLFAILAEACLPIAWKQHNNGAKFRLHDYLEDGKEAIHFMLEQKQMLKICLLATVLNFAIASMFQTILPFILRIHLKADNFTYSMIQLNWGLGPLCGVLLYSLRAKKLLRTNIWFFFLLISFCLFASWLTLSYRVVDSQSSWLLGGFISFCLAIFSIVSLHLLGYIQLHTPKEMVGRVMSIVFFLSTVAMPMGQYIYGWLGDHLTAKSLYQVIGLVAVFTLMLGIGHHKLFEQIKEARI
ncbi:MFS transporter [Vaginisenegalia massiliensis]|uniref:MFS transporter n=1 Tax=Vaginisenegalia massiliensis TaxID=2058294 RepID=UPI000F5479CE|nr:MFS transporter [Vaginisenegalia massiliensis]